MKFISDIAKVSAVMSVASLFFRQGIIKPYTLQPYEILIFISFSFTVLYLLLNKKATKTDPIAKRFTILALIILLLSFIGTLSAKIQFGIDDIAIKAMLIKTFQFLSVLVGMFTISYWGRGDRFRLAIYLSFFTSLIVSPFLLPFMKNLGEKLLITHSTGKNLDGFHMNPSDFANFLIPSLSILTALFLKSKKLLYKYLSWAVLVIVSGLLIYTGSRSGWLSFAIISVFITYMYSKKYNKAQVFFFIKKGFLIFIAVIFGFLILPHDGKIFAISRLFPQIVEIEEEIPKEYIAEKRREIFKKTSLFKAIEKIKEEPIISVPNQERQLLWPQAISLISREPLGLGFGYGYTSKAIKSSKIGDDFATSHNTFLQVALESGWLGFIIFLSGLYYLYKILKYIRNDSFEWIILSGASIGFFITLWFDERLYSLPWLWIWTGLIISKYYIHKTKNAQKEHGKSKVV